MRGYVSCFCCIVFVTLALPVAHVLAAAKAPDVAAVRQAAEGGNADAQCELGWMYSEGRGVDRDDAKAVDWMQKAAEQGNARAQYGMGYLFSTGKGVPEDKVNATLWYTKAAEQGHLESQFHLGWIYYHGQDVPQDYAKAATWFTKPAEGGNKFAQHLLGAMYWYGKGVPQDYAKAACWWRQSAEQGHTVSQLWLGMAYLRGAGVPQDDAQAALWLAKAAELNADAQRMLDDMYAEGRATPPAAMRINLAHMGRAEEVIKKYVSEKYDWNTSAYEILFDSKKSQENIVRFTVFYLEDEKLTSFGGGESFAVIFDMQKMEILRILYFQ